MGHRPALLALALALLLPAPAASAPLSHAQAHAVDAMAQGEIRAGATPGIAIGIVEDGLLVYARGFGLADIQRHIRAGAQTQFYVGSIAKEFTAACVLMLAQEKKLSLGDQVTKYVPELGVARGVTIEQLLRQTSGLPDYTAAPGIGHDPTKPVKMSALLAAVNRMKPAFPPGARFDYNNLNYAIAGLIVQRVSGVPLSVFMQTHIFQPLIMSSTFLAGDEGISKNAARGYTRENGKFVRVRPWDPSWLFGSGDLVTTVDDLAKWDVGLPLLLHEDSVRAMWSASAPAGGATQYGMGWVVDQRGGHPYVWHNGEIAGFHAMNALLPEQHIAVVVLTNADSLHSQTTVAPERLANRILNAIAPLPRAHFQSAVVTRAAEWLKRLQRNDIDRSQLTPEFSQYLSDRVVIQADLKGLGPVLSVVPVESFKRSNDTVYVFAVKFRHGAMRYQFATAPDGKIDGLLLQP